MKNNHEKIIILLIPFLKFLAGEKEDSNDNNHDRKDYNNNR